MKTTLLSAALATLACFVQNEGVQAGLTFQLLYGLNTNSGPSTPYAGLVEGADGNFYGTTYNGGTNNLGTVFQTTPGGALTTLISFSGTNGSFPYASLVQGRDGNFYGTTSSGGSGYDGTSDNGYGTVFKITTNGTLTTLISFDGTSGSSPVARLVQGSDGNFYGTASRGPECMECPSYGTVYQITPDGALTTLASFNYTNGANPYAGLVEGSDGDFYGTTHNGGHGKYGCGTVFKITTNGVLNTLVSFKADAPPFGGSPVAALVQASDGNFYGTAAGGGFFNCFSTVFKITPGGTLTTLNAFYGPNGSHPDASLVQGSDGNFYGTTFFGGSGYNGMPLSGKGTVFQLTPGGRLTTVVFFNGTNGGNPVAPLVQGSDGNFYGTASSGGSGGGGTIFRLVQPPVITAIASSNRNVTLTWTSFTNGNYRVEHKPALAATNWTALTPNVSATGSTASKTDNLEVATQRYYRIVLLP